MLINFNGVLSKWFIGRVLFISPLVIIDLYGDEIINIDRLSVKWW